jgi:hypothetical protein
MDGERLAAAVGWECCRANHWNSKVHARYATDLRSGLLGHKAPIAGTHFESGAPSHRVDDLLEGELHRARD